MLKKKKRGYPNAVLIGLGENQTTIWRIYSESGKFEKNIDLSDRRDSKQLYNHYEMIVNNIRPLIKTGIRSIIIVNPSKTKYSTQLIDHFKKRHRWLFE